MRIQPIVALVLLALFGCESEPMTMRRDSGPRADSGPCRRQCEDGNFCNGVETCDPDHELADTDGCVRGMPPCRNRCDENLDTCPNDCEDDNDGDGSISIACGGEDCADDDPNRSGLHMEVCDAEGVDEDCDNTTIGPDEDGDGFFAAGCCNGARCGRDCDDERPNVNPRADEICDGAGRDEDCNGEANPAALCSCEGNDTRPCAEPGACAAGMQMCEGGLWGDCSIMPTTETCNNVDDDCNGAVDDGDAATECTAEPNSTVACTMGSCMVTGCEMGFEDCTVDPGCETDITSTAACRSCDNACVPGASCGAADCEPRFDWVASATGPTANGDRSLALARSGAGIFVGGAHSGADFGMGAVAVTGAGDPVLVGLNDSGVVQWATPISDGGSGKITGVAADATGVFVTGVVSGNADFGAGMVTTATDHPFIARYVASSGALDWVQLLGAGSGSAGTVALEGANVYVTGATAAGDFGGMTSTGAGMFVASYTSGGVLNWVQQADVAGARGDAIAVEPGGAVVVTGSLSGTVTFGGSTETSGGGSDVFVAALSTSDGSATWSDVYGGAGDDAGRAIAADSGRLYIVGHIAAAGSVGGANVGPGAFTAAYATADGGHVHSSSLGGVQSTANGDAGVGITTHSSGVYLSGFYSGGTTLGGGALPAQGMLLASFDRDGAELWAIGLAGGNAEAQGVADGGGGALLAGRFRMRDFGDGAVDAGADGALFVARYAE